MSKKWGIIFIVLSSVAVTLSFQNCANVALTKQATEAEPLFAAGSGALCLDGDMSNFTVSSFYVTNLNLVLRSGALQYDNDSDGLSDVEEKRYGFDPYNRRSASALLDSICFQQTGNNNCASRVPTCDSRELSMGLNECDTKILGLQSVVMGSDTGIDTDGDGVPDIVEILRGTDPNVDDALADADNDGVTNGAEIAVGSDPRTYNDSVPDALRVSATMSKQTSTGSCTGEVWNMKINQVPWVMGPSFRDTAVKISANAIDFSHDANENLVVVWLKLVPKAGFSGNPRVYYKTVKVNKQNSKFSITKSDFVFMGEVAK